MLTHGHDVSKPPSRTVVLGAGGFIGAALVQRLRADKFLTLGLARNDIDLLDPDAASALAARLSPNDAIVVISARAPCKNTEMMVENTKMMGGICGALSTKPVAHIVYISSDAVYADEPTPLTERSPAAPTSLHGAMHLAREQMLASVAGETPYAIVRPTLVYGARDPHNGYGPNRFRRLANKGEPIVLFGEGEERRDHVLIDDVAELIVQILMRRSSGILNAATGSVDSFRNIAEQAVELANWKVPINGSPRSGPMPHNGYRPFDPAATYAAFPEFRYTPLADGMAQAQREEFP